MIYTVNGPAGEIGRLNFPKSVHLITAIPIALDSPDHLHPWGTKRDNSTREEFWSGLASGLGKKFSLLDLGCAGGGLVAQGAELGYDAIGLEGSDYWATRTSENTKQAKQWGYWHNRRLFTCDITFPFFLIELDYDLITQSEEILTPLISTKKFDVITAWEVFEHLNPERLQITLGNIWHHLEDDGFCFLSIGKESDSPEGHELHQIIQPPDWWADQLTKFGLFEIAQYPFDIQPVRILTNSSYLMLRKKK